MRFLLEYFLSLGNFSNRPTLAKVFQLPSMRPLIAIFNDVFNRHVSITEVALTWATLSQLRSISDRFGEDVMAVFDIETSLASRAVTGRRCLRRSLSH